jgi:hypothetical protein
MYSGRHRVQARSDGSYFLDRDPLRFKHVLNYLRDGDDAALPRDAQLRAELRVEADYYGLPGMRAALEDPDHGGALKGQADTGGGGAHASEVEGEDVLRGPGRMGTVRAGSVVVRGPDWKWGIQDGGPGTRGRVAAIGQLGGVPGWVQVKWPNGHFNGCVRVCAAVSMAATCDRRLTGHRRLQVPLRVGWQVRHYSCPRRPYGSRRATSHRHRAAYRVVIVYH